MSNPVYVPTFSGHDTSNIRQISYQPIVSETRGPSVSYDTQQHSFYTAEHRIPSQEFGYQVNSYPPQAVFSHMYYDQARNPGDSTALHDQTRAHTVQRGQPLYRAGNVESHMRADNDVAMYSTDWSGMLQESRNHAQSLQGSVQSPAQSLHVAAHPPDAVSSLNVDQLPLIENYFNLLSPARTNPAITSQDRRRRMSSAPSTGASSEMTPRPTRPLSQYPAPLPDLFNDIPTPGLTRELFKARRRFLLPEPKLLFTIEKKWTQHAIRAPSLIDQLRAACHTRLELTQTPPENIPALTEHYIALLFDKSEQEFLAIHPAAPIIRTQSRLEQQYRHLSGGLWREVYPDYKDTDGARERIARVSCNFRAMEWQIEILEGWIRHVKCEEEAVEAGGEGGGEGVVVGEEQAVEKKSRRRPVFGPQRRPGRPPGTTNRAMALERRQRAVAGEMNAEKEVYSTTKTKIKEKEKESGGSKQSPIRAHKSDASNNTPISLATQSPVSDLTSPNDAPSTPTHSPRSNSQSGV